jgi:hypothetical protein
VSDSGQLHVALPAAAPLGSDFSFSIMFSNLAQLFVGTVNLSVVVFPTLQVSSSSSFDVSCCFFRSSLKQAVVTPTFAVPGALVDLKAAPSPAFSF